MLFNTARKKRVKLILNNILGNVKGDFLEELEAVEKNIYSFRKFENLHSFELSYVPNYEKTMLFVSKHMTLEPKKSTVREFLTAFNDLKEKAEKEVLKRAKQGKK